MKTKLLSAATVLFLLLAWHVAFSADPKDGGGAPGAPQGPRPSGMPFYGKVGAVDKNARMLTLDGKEKDRFFYLTPRTRIHNAGKPATLNDVVIGRWVGGFVRETNGRPEVVTLNLGVSQRGWTNRAPVAAPAK